MDSVTLPIVLSDSDDSNLNGMAYTLKPLYIFGTACLLNIGNVVGYQANASAPVDLFALNLHTDSIIISKQVNNKKHKVKLYTDASKSVLFFTAGASENSWYQFFLFDVEGRLVKQLKLKGKQTTVLRNLGRGFYTFEIFKEDEKIETGNLSVI